jgi:peptidoglycan/LPS O-acetylase OafA/YrhL
MEKIYFMTHTRLDSFIAGIILAEYYLYFQKNSYKFSFSSNIRNMISIFLLVNLFFILFGTYWKYPLMQFVFNYNWYNIIAFLLGWYFITFDSFNDWFIKIFSFKFYIPISKISYTVFLFHEYIAIILGKNISFINFRNISDIKILLITIFIVVGCLIIGYIFYLLFEKPFYYLRFKFSKN